MNAVRQISLRFDRSTGARTRPAADYSISATISVVPDPLDPLDPDRSGSCRMMFFANCLALLKRSQDETTNIPNLLVGGRLGGYKYYDMDQAMAAALELPIKANLTHESNKML